MTGLRKKVEGAALFRPDTLAEGRQDKPGMTQP